MRSRTLRIGALLALAAVLLPAHARAQATTGSISGTVTDESKAILPGVTIVVINVETGVSARLVTNSVGFYLAPDLVPGNYSIRIEASGFSPLEVSDLIVKAGTTTTGDAQLKVGPTAQKVEVTAQAQLVETTASNFSTGISRRYLDNLPLEGRDIQTLVSLFPSP